MPETAWVDGDRPWYAHYAKGIPRNIGIPDRMLHECVGDAARRWPDRTALVYYGAKWSYRRFWEESERLAASFVRDGLRPGDRIAIYLPNCPAYPIAYFAALRVGASVAQISPLYLGQDLLRLLEDSRPKLLVTLEILYPNLAKIADQFSLPALYVARLREFYPFWKRPFVNSVLRRRGMSTSYPEGPNVRPWTRSVRTPGTISEFHGDPAQTVAVLQYTGGTTGKPKAAMLSHRNLVANALQSHAWFAPEASGQEIVLAAIPFFHVYGMTVALNYPLLDGMTIVMQTRPEVNELLGLIDKYRPTQFPGVPALYQAINQHPKVSQYNIRSIKVCLSGSAPLPLEVARQFEALTGGNLVEGYGLTEASPVTHANPLQGGRRAGSVGLPLPDTDQLVRSLEDGSKNVAVGEPGELLVRGPQVMLGYYNQPAETALVLQDGWLRTGDIARLDADGFCYIVDRKKDIIIVGGFKVYPREVEEVLFQHPEVADAAAVGVPDAERGEVVKAFVVRKPGASVTEATLIQFVRDRIAHYKAPRTIEFRTTLPRSGVQKVLRRVLREDATVAAVPVPTDPGSRGPGK
ncbi:MAG: long-chain fatty acid--CoA ligase [Thermoplasmata archaeon]